MKINKEQYDLIVIGGGPSGMMMAGRAGQLGAKVLLLEKNKELGKKLKITGGGRCNLTNAIFDTHKFLDNFPESKQFLYSPFSKFSVKDTFNFFEKRKMPLIKEARNRVFPKSEKAEDVFNTLIKNMQKHNVEIKTGIRIFKLITENNKIISAQTKNGQEFFAKNFAIATGGASAPFTGSTGDGFKILKEIGLTIEGSNPNVVPLTSDTKWVHDLSGTRLSFMTIRFIQKEKTQLKKTGKILFTHFGLSGPLILNSAFEVQKLLKKGKVTASIDLFPDTTEGALNNRIIKLFDKNKNKVLKNVLPEILQKNLAKEFFNILEENLADIKIHSITKDDRKKIVKKMKDMPLSITGTLGLDHAVISDGGVNPKEVNFKNFTSKKFPNLYLLGDTLNINRPSGGFSLQLCWTTGWVAGDDVGKKYKK